MLLQRHLPNFFVNLLRHITFVYHTPPTVMFSAPSQPRTLVVLKFMFYYRRPMTPAPPASLVRVGVQERERETLQHTNSQLWRVWDFIVIEDIILIGDGWDDDGISLSTTHAVLPCTEESVQLVGVPDVLLINCRQFTLVTAEDKCVKEYPSTKPQKSGNTLTKHLFQCPSFALWHGNAAMWGTRLPAIPPSVDGCL